MLKHVLKDKIFSYLRENDVRKELNLGDDLHVNFLAQGEYNINYVVEDRVGKYVFRINMGSQLEIENQIEYEFNAIKRLEASGVTPKAYFVDSSKSYFDYGILIMEFLEGKPLDYSRDLSKAAHVFSNIHSIILKEEDYKSFIVENNIFTDRIAEGKRLLKDFFPSALINIELKNFFYKFLQWSEDNKYKEKYFIDSKWKVINNTEVNSHNFIIGTEKSYLIDWEKPVISDPCQDLTQFLAETTTLWKSNYVLDKEEKENFFKIYESNIQNGRNDIRERVNMYTPYLYLRALAWGAYAWVEYQKPDKGIKNMDTLKKIEDYLDIDFMKKLLSKWF